MKYEFTLDDKGKVIAIVSPISTNFVAVETDKELRNDMIGFLSVENNELIFDETGYTAEKEKEKSEEEHIERNNEQTTRLAELFVSQNVYSDDFMERIDAQLLYTSLMTDTLIEEEI